MPGAHRPCGRGGIKFSICHEIPNDHIVTGSSEIMDEFLLLKFTILSRLMVTDVV